LPLPAEIAMAMKRGPQPTDSKFMVTETFAAIVSNLEKLGFGDNIKLQK